jgi:hypothetical protein
MKLQVVMTAMLVAAFCADAATRALPMGTWSFRAWEAVSAFRASSSPFEPRAAYDSPHASGDLANLGNLRTMRVYRRETFTTDAYGFRNPPGRAESGTVSALLIGDSFAVGSGVPDHLTLAAQLTDTWGITTYTVAPWLPTSGSMAAVTAMLRLKPGSVVIYQQAHFYDASHAATFAPSPLPPVSVVERMWRSVDSPIWPMQIVVNRAVKRWQDGDLLPNPYASAVRRVQLRNGDNTLAYANDRFTEEMTPGAVEVVSRSRAFVEELADRARGLGLRFVVVLVPLKMTVYEHLRVQSPHDEPRMPGNLAETDRQFRAAGLSVVNLFEPLTAGATRAARRYQYLYWRDDTHWNPAGIAIAAREIAAALATEPAHAP